MSSVAAVQERSTRSNETAVAVSVGTLGGSVSASGVVTVASWLAGERLPAASLALTSYSYEVPPDTVASV
jgi:hypothetical protein